MVPFAIGDGPSEICVVANGISSAPCPLTVFPFRLHWPIFEEAIVARLIGSLADGPLWVLGPNGSIPIDPWGPKIVKQAPAAWKEIISAVKMLQKLGKEANANRQKIANAAPLAPDDGDSAEEESIKEKEKKKTKK
jgi:hypothetical protein